MSGTFGDWDREADEVCLVVVMSGAVWTPAVLGADETTMDACVVVTQLEGEPFTVLMRRIVRRLTQLRSRDQSLGTAMVLIGTDGATAEFERRVVTSLLAESLGSQGQIALLADEAADLTLRQSLYGLYDELARGLQGSSRQVTVRFTRAHEPRSGVWNRFEVESDEEPAAEAV